MFDWNKIVPKKVSIPMWRVEMEILPLLLSLARRHIQVPLVQCPICGDCEESAEHLFVSCRFAESEEISKWCKIPDISFFHFGIY